MVLLLLLLGSFVDDSHHTSQVGTQLYMSPEQVILLYAYPFMH